MEAKMNPGKYTDDQLKLMVKGKAPKGSDGQPMEVHHRLELSAGGTNTFDNMDFMTRTEHRLQGNLKGNHPNLFGDE